MQVHPVEPLARPALAAKTCPLSSAPPQPAQNPLGAELAIGHPHPETLAVLADEIPQAKALGYEFVVVSRLLDRPARPEEPAAR